MIESKRQMPSRAVERPTLLGEHFLTGLAFVFLVIRARRELGIQGHLNSSLNWCRIPRWLGKCWTCREVIPLERDLWKDNITIHPTSSLHKSGGTKQTSGLHPVGDEASNDRPCCLGRENPDVTGMLQSGHLDHSMAARPLPDGDQFLEESSYVALETGLELPA